MAWRQMPFDLANFLITLTTLDTSHCTLYFSGAGNIDTNTRPCLETCETLPNVNLVIVNANAAAGMPRDTRKATGTGTPRASKARGFGRVAKRVDALNRAQ